MLSRLHRRVVRPTAEVEFIALFAFLTSLTALSIDAILPGLPAIGQQFAVDAHLVVSVLVIGMALGELCFGPMADAQGRKLAIACGIALFVIGALLAYRAESYTGLLIGRFLQGVGVAGPKIGSRAAIRDRYTGNDMARVMSILMSVLIIVPMLAPAVGQAVMIAGNWRDVFLLYAIAALFGLLWLFLRQPETLSREARQPFRWRRILAQLWRIGRHPRVGSYTLIAGLVFGCLAGFYGIAAPLFADAFDVVSMFPVYFALLAAGAGGASWLNSRLVRKAGMVVLCRLALRGLLFTGIGFAMLSVLQQGEPGLVGFMVLQTLAMFFIGMVFGNIGAMAMEPLGAVAGVGASVIAAGSSVVAFFVALVIGWSHHDNLLPHAAGLMSCALLSLGLLRFASRHEATYID